MRALRNILVVAMLSVLFVPSSAAAQKCSGEDVAAIDQYCELLPTAEGQAPSDEPQRGLMTVLPVAERQQLWRAGPAGRALLSMPTGAHLHGRDRKPRPLPGAAAAISGWLAERDQAEDSPVRAIGTAAWDGDRLSELFRWLMLMSTVGLVGTAWVRRRR